MKQMVEEKILVGWDGSNQAQNALLYAIDQAKEKNLEKINVVYIVEEIPTGLGLDMEDDVSLYDYEIFEKLESRGKELLKEAKSIGKEKGIKIETDMKYGYSPAVEIVKYAEDNNIDHIIVGSHGRSGISRILLGSVAEGIVEKAHCIVTIVRQEWPSKN